MPISTISSKGQVTLPAGLRKRLGMAPNDKVILEVVHDALVIRKAPDFFEWEGFLGKALPREEERRRMAQHAATRAKGGKS